MAQIEAKLAALGLVLPPPLKPPAGVVLPFRFVRIAGARSRRRSASSGAS